MNVGPRKRLEIATRRAAVCKHYLDGKSQSEIAALVGVTQATVSGDIAAVTKQLLKEASGSVAEKTALTIARLEKVLSQAWEGWRRSCGPRRKQSAKQVEIPSEAGKAGQVKRVETSAVEEKRDGNPRFLDQARMAIMARAKVEGLLADEITLLGKDRGPIEIKYIEAVQPSGAPATAVVLPVPLPAARN